jgi:hypothetical protein
MTNRTICLQFSLLDANSGLEYQEVVKTKTDEFGMVNITIGSGTQTGGYASSFASIVWTAAAEKSMKVALDATGLCNQYEELSEEKLDAVPFANAAITAGNVSGVVALANGGTGATTAAGARTNLGIGNIDNTSDLNKPMSTATKTYIDSQLTNSTIVDADATTKGKIQLAGDLSGTAAAPTVPGLALKENAANKSTTTTLGTSNVLFPTQNAVKTYVDTAIAGATIVDADANTKGKIQLAGDLAGTAAAPTVPGLALKLDASLAGVPNGIATLNSSGIIPANQLPPISVASTNVVGSQAAMLALSNATVGSIAVRTDVNKNFILSTAGPSVLANWIELLTPGAPVQSVNGLTGAIQLSKADINLANVDNTSDAAKPVSTATQNALNLKLNTNQVGVPNGTASLNALGKIPTEQIPAISFSSVKVLGSQAEMLAQTNALIGSVVIRTDVNKNYVLAQSDPTILANWLELLTPAPPVQSVNGYVGNVSLTKADLGLGNVDNTGDINKPVSTATQTALDLKANLASPSFTGTVSGITKSMVGLANVDNTSDLNKPVSTATQTALDLKANTVDLTAETTRATAAEATLTTNVATNATAIAAETTRATAAEATLTTNVATNATAIAAETTRATAAEATLTTNVATNATAIAAETTRATAAEATLTTDVATNATAIAAETTRATAAEALKANATDVTSSLALKEDAANKTLSVTTDGASDVKFPSAKAVKTYVDTAVSSSSTTAVPYTGATGPVNLGAYNLTLNGMTVGRPVNTYAFSTQNTALGVGVMGSYIPTSYQQDYNTGIGYYALNKLTTGARNTATGSTALYLLTTGNYNSAFGMDALSAVSTGGYNTGIGIAAGKSIQTSNHNTMMGYYAGFGITGSNNIVIGSSILPTSGTGITTGSNNTIIGSGITGLATSLSNNIVLADGQGNIRAQHDGTNGWTLGTISSGTWNGTEIAIAKGGTGATTAAAALTNLGAEPTANKSTATDLGNSSPSDVLFPTQKAVKAYVDTQTAAAGVSDGSITSAKIADGTIVNADVATNAAIAYSKLNLTSSIVATDITTDAVETAKIKDANVTATKLAANAVETAKIKDANVTDAKLDKANIPLSGFGAAAADVDLGSNKLTNVTDPTNNQDAATKNYVDTATAGITTLADGKIYLGNASNVATEVTLSGDVTMTNAGVTAIGTSKVVAGMLATDAVETAKIKDANVTTAKLADAAVTTAKITDANVTATKLAANAVETAKIKDANVTDAKLDKANIPLSGFGAAAADVDLGSNKLTNVTDPTNNQDAATKNYVDTATAGITTLADGKIYLGNASNVATEVTLSGDVTMTNAGVTAIGTGKVVVGMLATDAVETIKIKDANVTEAKLAADAVTSAKILNGTIVVADLAANAVEEAKIKDANVTTAKLADAAVTTAKITDANITTAKLADTAVTTVKITDANVTYAKIQNVSATGKVLGRVSAGAGVIEEIATTGSGNVVRATSPTLVTPDLGTPSAINLTNATGLPIATAVTGVLPVANGGTGSATQNFVDLTTDQTIAGVKTLSSDMVVNSVNIGLGKGAVSSNTAVGKDAISATATGADNSALGYNALKVVSSGARNTAVGSLAASALTTGTDNTVLGHRALSTVTSSQSNTAIGNDALKALGDTTNDRNTAVGTGSFSNLTTGQYNVGVGQGSLLNATSGSSNVAVGKYAGFRDTNNAGVTSSNQSIFIGAETKPLNSTSTNEIVIGYDARGLGNNSTVLGNSLITQAKIFGALDLPDTTTSTSTTSGALKVAGGAGIAENLNVGGNAKITGTLQIAGGTPGAGKVLTSDSNGLGSWTTPTGVTTMAAIGSTPNANGATISGVNLNLEPASASYGGIVTTGTQTFAGAKTFSPVLTAASGLGTGTKFTPTLTAAANGDVLVGLDINPTFANGSYTTLTNYALRVQGIGIGLGGGGITTNTAIGSGTLLSNSTGANNTGLGYRTLFTNDTGTGNTALGTFAGAYIGGTGSVANSYGTNSTFIGYNTSPLANGDDNEVVIAGGNATTRTVGLGSNTTLIGNAATTQTRIMGALDLPNTTVSNSATTGALKVAGGAGIAGALNVGGNAKITGTLEIDGGTPGAGKVLTSDANGVGSWTTLSAVPYTGATGAVDLGAYDLKVNGLTVGRGNTGDGTNTAVGASALLTNTAGTDNTAVGYNALKTTTGSLNSAFGSLALKTNTSGTRNAAFGTMAIQANSTGTNNSGFGYGTLYATTASDNTGIGYLAGYNVTSGAKNIFIGSLAGNSISTASLANTTGLNSVLIGYDVRPLANGDTNEIVLSGYNGSAGTVGLGSNTTTIGNSSTTKSQIYGALTTVAAAAASSGVGESSIIEAQGSSSSSAAGSVTINAGDNSSSGAGGNINLNPGTSSTGTAGKVIVNGGDMTVNGITVGKGTGNRPGNVALGETALFSANTGSGNVGIGYQTLYSNTGGSNNTAVGYQAMVINASGNSNTAIGNGALYYNTASNNTAVGTSALNYNTTGQNNTAVGISSAWYNKTGSNNTSMGHRSLYASSETNTSDNTAIGYNALSSNASGGKNTALGSEAGGYTTSGAENIAVGYKALYYNTTGSYNTAIGNNAGPNGSTYASTKGIFIGYNALSKGIAAASDEIVIGANTTGNGANTVTIGNSSNTANYFNGTINVTAGTAASATNGNSSTITAQNAGSGNQNGGDVILTPGTKTGTGTAGIVKVNGQIQITGGTPAAGEVLVSDANGLATWSNALGSAVTTTTASYAITLAESIVFYTGTAAGTFSIPAATAYAGKEITIKNKTAFGITITPATGTIYIDNANASAASVSIGIEASNNWIKLVSDGTQWNVLRALF